MPRPAVCIRSFALLALACALAACGDKDPGQEGGAAAPPATDAGREAGGPEPAQTPPTPGAPALAGEGLEAGLRARVDAALARGRAFLLARQAEDGGFGDPALELPPNVGFTALAAGGLLATTPRAQAATDPALLSALRFIAGHQKESGAIVDDPRYTNYQTSAAGGVLALAKVGEFAPVATRARNFLAQSQIAADPADPSFGGFPYKEGEPADLSNVQFAATTLHDLGLAKDHEVWQRLVAYLQRVQNYSENQPESWELEREGEARVYVLGADGGAVYSPRESKAGEVKRADGRWELKSYGSMTYALLKCLLFAGVDPKDPRVVLALQWISNHWTVERNPGFEGAEDPAKAGQQGYYYYLYTAARALAEVERFTKQPFRVVDAGGRAHDWRQEICAALLARQADDGSWVNPAMDRWNEGSPILCTGYALQTLAFAAGRLP